MVWVLLTYKSRLHRFCDVRKPAQKSVAQLIAMVAKHDLPDNRWPALFQFLEQHVRSDNAVHREVPPFPFIVTAYLGNFGNPFKVNILDKQPENCLGILLKFVKMLGIPIVLLNFYSLTTVVRKVCCKHLLVTRVQLEKCLFRINPQLFAVANISQIMTKVCLTYV